jgi:hypothetical protein
MRRVVAALVPLIFLSAAWALDEPKDKAEPDKPKSAAEKLAELQKEIQKARGDLIAKYQKAKEDKEKDELRDQIMSLGRSYAEKFLDVAETDPKDPAALQALTTVLTQAEDSPQAMKAADLVVKYHLGDTKQLPNLLGMLGRSPSPAGEKVLRAVMAQARDNDAKATFALAQNLKEQAAAAREFKDASPDEVKQLTARIGEAGVKRLQDADADKLEAESAAFYERTIKEYADVKVFNRPLGPQAKGELNEMRHLSVGKPAPEITAEDIDGTKFKLSDYRGKVVLLDFWGNW